MKSEGIYDLSSSERSVSSIKGGVYIFISNLSTDIGYLLSSKLEKSYIIYQEDYLFKNKKEENIVDRYNWYNLNNNIITLKDKFDFIIISGCPLLLDFIKIKPDICITDIEFSEENINKEKVLQKILDMIL